MSMSVNINADNYKNSRLFKFSELKGFRFFRYYTASNNAGVDYSGVYKNGIYLGEGNSDFKDTFLVEGNNCLSVSQSHIDADDKRFEFLGNVIFNIDLSESASYNKNMTIKDIGPLDIFLYDSQLFLTLYDSSYGDNIYLELTNNHSIQLKDYFKNPINMIYNGYITAIVAGIDSDNVFNVSIRQIVSLMDQSTEGTFVMKK